MKSISDYQTESSDITEGNNKKNNKSIEHNLTANNFGTITSIIINMLSQHDLLSLENLKKFFPINLENIKTSINNENKNTLSQEIVSILKLAHFGEITRLSTIDGVKEKLLIKDLNSRLNSLKDDVLYQFQPDSNQDQNKIQEQLDAIAEQTQKTLSLEPLHESLPKNIKPGQLNFAYNLSLIHKGDESVNPIINTGNIESEQDNQKQEQSKDGLIDELIDDNIGDNIGDGVGDSIIEIEETYEQDEQKEEIRLEIPRDNRDNSSSWVAAPPSPITAIHNSNNIFSINSNSSPHALHSQSPYHSLDIDHETDNMLNNNNNNNNKIKKTCWQNHQIKCIGITAAIAILSAGLAYYYLYVFKEPATLGDITWDTQDEHNSILNFDENNQFSPASNTSMPFTNGTLNVVYENTHHWKGELSKCYSYSDFNIRKIQDCLNFLQGLYLSIKNPSPGEYTQPIADFKTNEEKISLFRQLTRLNNKADLISPNISSDAFNTNDLNIKLSELNLKIDDPLDQGQLYKLAMEFYATNGAPIHHQVVFKETTGNSFDIQEYLQKTSVNLNAFKYLNSVNIRVKFEEGFNLRKNSSQTDIMPKVKWVSPQTKVQTINLPYLPAPEFSVSKPISHTIKLTDLAPTQIIPSDSQILIASKSGLPISMEFVIIGLDNDQLDAIDISSGNKSININQAYTFDTSAQMKQWLKNSQINLNDNICKTDETLELPLSIHFSQTKDKITRTKIIECDIKAIGAIENPLEFINLNPEPHKVVNTVTRNKDALLNINGITANHSGNKYDPYNIEIKHITNTLSLNHKINLELGTETISDMDFNNSKLEISRDDLNKININYMPLHLSYPIFSEPLGSVLSSQICFNIINKITNHSIQSCSDRYLIEVVAPDLKLSLCKTRAFGLTNKIYYLQNTLCPVITGAPAPTNWTINYNPQEIGFNLLTNPAQYDLKTYHNNNSGEIIAIGNNPYQIQQFINNLEYELTLPENEQIESEILMRVSNDLNDPSQVNPIAQLIFYRIRPGADNNMNLGI
jgi:hypothetical protein